MFKRKQACVGCHFFIKEARSLPSPNPITVDVTSEERAQATTGDFSWAKDTWTLACHFNVWDEGYDFDKNKRKEIIVDKNRRGFCFFWRYRQGMMIPAAKALQEREAQARDASRDRRLTIAGLWIAALALLANVGLKLVEQLHWWPFPKQ